jgi:hypothetical protein
MPPYINADLIHPYARVSIEETFNEDEVLGWLEEEDTGLLATPEMEEEAREASGYYADDDALCIPRSEVTDCGQMIPAWAFS